MNLLPKFLRFAVLAALVAVSAPSAHAGLRDVLENARDTAKCASKAVLQPLKTLERGIKNFGDMGEREYEREADKSMKEAMKECLEASENIMARSFGVEKVAAKARELAASAKSAADQVSKWFDGKRKPREDGRMALSVGEGEREFYKREAGVLGAEPLPAAKPSPLPEDIERLFEEKRRLNERTAAWEAGTADDPWADNRNSTWDDPWSAGAPSEPGTPGPDAAGMDRDDWARDEARSEEVEQSGPGYGAAEDHDSYSKALEEMERREIAEAQRKLELDAEHRRQAAKRRELAEARRRREEAEHRAREAERSRDEMVRRDLERRQAPKTRRRSGSDLFDGQAMFDDLVRRIRQEKERQARERERRKRGGGGGVVRCVRPGGRIVC